jgi:hypothetical protein
MQEFQVKVPYHVTSWNQATRILGTRGSASLHQLPFEGHSLKQPPNYCFYNLSEAYAGQVEHWQVLKVFQLPIRLFLYSSSSHSPSDLLGIKQRKQARRLPYCIFSPSIPFRQSVSPSRPSPFLPSTAVISPLAFTCLVTYLNLHPPSIQSRTFPLLTFLLKFLLNFISLPSPQFMPQD